MTESMPPTLAQLQQLNRSLTEKVLDKAASDPAWKQQLLDDPEAAMRAANFPETQQLEQMQAGAGEGEVRGQVLPGDIISGGNTGNTINVGNTTGNTAQFSSIRNCTWYTYYWW